MPIFDDETPDTGHSAESQPSLPALGGSPDSAGTQSVSLPTDQGTSPPPSSEEPPADMTPSQAAAWEALPKAWKKNYETHWGSLSPELKQYIHTREQQAFQGITTYRNGHERWTKAIQPFEQVLGQHPEVDPVELVQVLAHNHLRLAQGTPAERRELLTNIARHYGVDLAQAAGQAQPPAGQQAQAPFTQEQIALLQQMLQPVVGQAQAAAQFTQEQRAAEANKSVDKFFSDSKNVYAEDVAQDMLQILQSRKAETLEEAYELAIMRNPEVKARYLADLVAKSSPAPIPTQLNLKSSPTPATPSKPATMEESINAVIQKHYGT
jgi:hypothetical protein